MTQSRKQVLILDDQDGPQFFYEDEIRGRLDVARAGVIKCRSLESIESEVERAKRGEIEIVAVIADIEIYDRDRDGIKKKKAGVCAARLLIEHMLRTSPGLYGKKRRREVFNYVVCSRYLETASVNAALKGVEAALQIRLPNKLERPVGLDVFRATIEEVFSRVGVGRVLPTS